MPARINYIKENDKLVSSRQFKSNDGRLLKVIANLTFTQAQIQVVETGEVLYSITNTSKTYTQRRIKKHLKKYTEEVFSVKKPKNYLNFPGYR